MYFDHILLVPHLLNKLLIIFSNEYPCTMSKRIIRLLPAWTKGLFANGGPTSLAF